MQLSPAPHATPLHKHAPVEHDQGAAQLVLQQNPSAQVVLWHAASLLHAEPSIAFGSHATSLQNAESLQSESVVQFVKQPLGPHLNSPHETHAPAPSQRCSQGSASADLHSPCGSRP